MSSAVAIWIIIIGAIVGVWYLYRQGKMPWLKRVRMPRIPRIPGIPKIPKLRKFSAETQIERLRVATEQEMARAEELRLVLEAKRELAKARAENSKLRKEIDGVSERSVEKEKRANKKAQEAEIAAKKVKPKRL